TPDGTRILRKASELGPSESSRGVLDVLVRGRLVHALAVEGEPGYELSHEALARAWPTLADWISSTAAGQRALERLENASAEGERMNEAPELLWSRAQLRELPRAQLGELGARDARFVAKSGRRVRARIIGWIAVSVAAPLGVAIALGLAQMRARS